MRLNRNHIRFRLTKRVAKWNALHTPQKRHNCEAGDVSVPITVIAGSPQLLPTPNFIAMGSYFVEMGSENRKEITEQKSN